MSFPLFQENIENRWTQLRSTTLHNDSINTIIDSCYNFLSEAQERNFTKWDILGKYVWPNFYIGETYEEEIEILKVWLSERLNWLDDSLLIDIPEDVIISPFIVYPNPFVDEITISVQNPVIESLTFILFDSFGRQVYLEEVKSYMLLQKSISFNFENLNLSTGFYFYHINWNKENVSNGKLIKYKK